LVGEENEEEDEILPVNLCQPPGDVNALPLPLWARLGPGHCHYLQEKEWHDDEVFGSVDAAQKAFEDPGGQMFQMWNHSGAKYLPLHARRLGLQRVLPSTMKLKPNRRSVPWLDAAAFPSLCSGAPCDTWNGKGNFFPAFFWE
jgi:hypothetical protein